MMRECRDCEPDQGDFCVNPIKGNLYWCKNTMINKKSNIISGETKISGNFLEKFMSRKDKDFLRILVGIIATIFMSIVLIPIAFTNAILSSIENRRMNHLDLDKE